MTRRKLFLIESRPRNIIEDFRMFVNLIILLDVPSLAHQYQMKGKLGKIVQESGT